MDKRMKNKTQVLAYSRRQRENNTFSDIADALPIQENAKDLDKASILRLAIHYLKLRDLIRDGNEAMEEEGEKEGEEELGGGDGMGLPGTSSSSVSNGSLQSTADPTISDFLPNFSKDVVQALDGFLLVLSGDGRVLFSSESIANYLGLRQVDVIGVNVEDLIHPQDCTEVKRIFQSQGHDSEQMFDDKEPYRRKFVVRMRCAFTPSVRSITRCSNFKPIYCSCFLKFGKSGQTKGQFLGLMVFCKLATITKIKEMVVGTFFKTKHSLDLSYTKVDTRIRWILGYDPSEMTGLKAYQYFHPEDLDVTSSCHMNLLSNGISHSPCYRFMTRWGDWIWCRSKSLMVFNKKTQLPEGIIIYTWVVRLEEEDDRMVAIQRGEDGEQHKKKYDNSFSTNISSGNGMLDVSALANPVGESLEKPHPITPSPPACSSSFVKLEEIDPVVNEEPHSSYATSPPLSAASAQISSSFGDQSSGSPISPVGVAIYSPQMGVASMPSPPKSMPSPQMGVASMPSPPMGMPSSQMGVASMPPLSAASAQISGSFGDQSSGSPNSSVGVAIYSPQMGVASMPSPPMGMPSPQMGVSSPPVGMPSPQMGVSSPPMGSPVSMPSPQMGSPVSMPSPQMGVTYPTPPHSVHEDTDSFMNHLLSCDGLTDLIDPSAPSSSSPSSSVDSVGYMLSPPYTPYFTNQPPRSTEGGNMRKISPPYSYDGVTQTTTPIATGGNRRISPPYNQYDTSHTSPLPLSTPHTIINPFESPPNLFESPLNPFENDSAHTSTLYSTNNTMHRYSNSHMTSSHTLPASQSTNIYSTPTHQATPMTFMKEISGNVTQYDSQSSSGSLSPSVELHTTFVPNGNASLTPDSMNFPLGVDITMETLNYFDYSEAAPLQVRQDLVNSKRAMYSGALPTGHVTGGGGGRVTRGGTRAKNDVEASNSISQWSLWLQESAPPPILS